MPPLKLSGNHTQHTLNTHLTHTHTHTQAWNSLPGSVRSGGRPSREEALQAVAVLNRIRRLLSETSGAGLQPINRTVIFVTFGCPSLVAFCHRTGQCSQVLLPHHCKTFYPHPLTVTHKITHTIPHTASHSNTPSLPPSAPHNIRSHRGHDRQLCHSAGQCSQV